MWQRSAAAATPSIACSIMSNSEHSALCHAPCVLGNLHEEEFAQVCLEGRASGGPPWEQALGGLRWSGSTGSQQPAGAPSAGAPGQQLPLHLQHELAAQVGVSRSPCPMHRGSLARQQHAPGRAALRGAGGGYPRTRHLAVAVPITCMHARQHHVKAAPSATAGGGGSARQQSAGCASGISAPSVLIQASRIQPLFTDLVLVIGRSTVLHQHA